MELAVEVGAGDDFGEVLEAGGVFGEDGEVVVIFEAGDFFAEFFFAGGDVEFAADDGFDFGFFGGLVEIDAAVEVAVVGHGDGGHFEFHGFGDEFVDAHGAIEEGVLGVDVEMDEGIG